MYKLVVVAELFTYFSLLTSVFIINH